ncbi:MAG: carbohydrate binding family 9 domain-containing protein [Gemmatimonadetes bacterium]|nr:carbohydrate binding family 9 domain-containing protein [Gemmatimonadota bacterium]
MLKAAVLDGELRLDGTLDEAAWAVADSIAGLTETEPDQGGTPTGRTVVKALVNGAVLVVGIRADDPEPDRIVSYAKARDAGLQGEDYVKFVLDTFQDGRSGYIFAINPGGARFDALVANRGEGENSDWDAVWEAATARTAEGWSAEVRIPIRSLIFKGGLDRWGFNIERRIQRLQETSRWASATRDYRVGQTARAGLLSGLPQFGLGLGLSVRPALTGGLERPNADSRTDDTGDLSLDLTERLGSNLLGSLTLNTDFAETEVDTRRTNLTRFPLFFPEKRTFFLEGAEVFDFGLTLGNDLLPFHSRRVGLLQGREVPIVAGAKVNGVMGRTNVGVFTVRANDVADLAPASTMAAVRLKQNVLAESSLGMIATFGDPEGRDGSWTAGADFTYQTSRFRGNKNFLVGAWGLVANREGLTGDRTAGGFKIDYPNDDWDIVLTYNRIGESFQPSLGFVPRPGVQTLTGGMNFRHRFQSRVFRLMFYELQPRAVFDLGGTWESYRIFTAPINWRFESGDRFEFNWVPEGERLIEPFEVAEGVTIQPGAYHYARWRLEAQFASQRKLAGMITWWFGGFYDGSLHQIILRSAWNPSPLVTIEVNAERNIGDLPAGEFTADLIGTRLRLNLSPDLQLASFVQYDTDSESIGSNTRLRWTFHPLGDLFVVYNHNLRDRLDRWSFDSNQLLLKLQYTLRY